MSGGRKSDARPSQMEEELAEEKPNFITKAPAEAIGRSVSHKIRDPDFRFRVNKLVVDDLTGDMENARLATKKEAAQAKDSWVLPAMAKGAPVHTVHIKHARRKRIARLRKLLIPFTYANLRGSAEQVAKAQRLMKKAAHMSLKDLEAALDEYDAVWLDYQAIVIAAEEQPIFDADAFFSPSGNLWRLIRSKAELGRVGIALNNCVAPRRAYHLHYWRTMMRGTGALWALYTPAGACIGLAFIELRNKCLEQARGPRNAAIADHRDVPALTAYLNLPVLRDRIAIVQGIMEQAYGRWTPHPNAHPGRIAEIGPQRSAA